MNRYEFTDKILALSEQKVTKYFDVEAVNAERKLVIGDTEHIAMSNPED